MLCPGASQVSQDVLLLDHEQRKFEALPQAQRDAAVGAAVRLILFKGACVCGGVCVCGVVVVGGLEAISLPNACAHAYGTCRLCT